MKATELRIGNWIYDSSNTPVKVTAQRISDIDNEFVIAKPIPLTEEILLKAGFDMIQLTEKETTHYCNMRTNFGYPALKLNDYALLKSNAQTPTGYLFLESLRIRCKYLHQLQNLYFALTGEELNIQL